MTAVPKPLKFLRPQFQTLVDAYDKIADASTKRVLADVISVLAMTSGKEEDRRVQGRPRSRHRRYHSGRTSTRPVAFFGRLCLKYRLLGQGGDVSDWGHEYVRHLAGELGSEYESRLEEGKSVEDLMALVGQIVPYHCSHNAEPEAVDLLLEARTGRCFARICPTAGPCLVAWATWGSPPLTPAGSANRCN